MFFITPSDCYSNIVLICSYPVDKGRILNVHKTLRRRSRRLLSVLRTFNFRRVFGDMITTKLL